MSGVGGAATGSSICQHYLRNPISNSIHTSVGVPGDKSFLELEFDIKCPRRCCLRHGIETAGLCLFQLFQCWLYYEVNNHHIISRSATGGRIGIHVYWPASCIGPYFCPDKNYSEFPAVYRSRLKWYPNTCSINRQSVVFPNKVQVLPAPLAPDRTGQG